MQSPSQPVFVVLGVMPKVSYIIYKHLSLSLYRLPACVGVAQRGRGFGCRVTLSGRKVHRAQERDGQVSESSSETPPRED